MSNVNVTRVGDGKVVLIAGGGKEYSGIAAKFCRAGVNQNIDDIIATPDTKKIIEAIIESRHHAALEFDDFIFGVEGYARVTEVQLVRKRLASYMISSGRAEKNGKRSFDVAIPDDIKSVKTKMALDPTKVNLTLTAGDIQTKYTLADLFPIIRQQFRHSRRMDGYRLHGYPQHDRKLV